MNKPTRGTTREQFQPIELGKLSGADLDALFRSLPKTDIHCHLDGSLRIGTVSELCKDRASRKLAKELGYRLPQETEPEELQAVLSPGVDCSSLNDYLRAFDITCAILQTPESLERAAYELALDVASENVWYLEVRFAPMRHWNRLMDGLAVIQAVDRGLARAESECKGKLRTAIIVCAMRNFSKDISAYYRTIADLYRYSAPRELASFVSLETARLTVRARESGLTRVVGFDLAGPELNYPPSHHIDAFEEIINNLLSITVHAGEAFGPASIKQAVTHLNAHRLGHGTRILEENGTELLHFLQDHRITIEVCLTSNLQTKAVRSLAEHPFRRLLDEEVRVPLCTDNRMISGTDSTKELLLAYRAFHLTGEEIRRVILYGFKSGFLPYADRRELLLAAKAVLRDKGLAD